MVNFLGGEIFCALGSKPERIANIRNERCNTLEKQVNFNGECERFPFYMIDAEERTLQKEQPVAYIIKACEKLFAALNITTAELQKCALFLGTSAIDLSLMIALKSAFVPELKETFGNERYGHGYYAQKVLEYFGLQKCNAYNYNTACTSSANALLDAKTMLENGTIEYALVIGVELYSDVSLEGFATMQLLSKEKMRTFDEARDGIVLGESVSVSLLCKEDRISTPWKLLGGMSNCETFSPTGANPDGSGLAEVMDAALKSAGVEKDRVSAIKAHGTASMLNDIAEMRAMKRTFEKVPPFLSLKPYIGHTLGSCGLTETLLFMECIDSGFIPKSLNFQSSGEEFDFFPLLDEYAIDKGDFMMNFFGFGGNNVSFMLRKE